MWVSLAAALGQFYWWFSEVSTDRGSANLIVNSTPTQYLRGNT
jgi:hypothetical protein